MKTLNYTVKGQASQYIFIDDAMADAAYSTLKFAMDELGGRSEHEAQYDTVTIALETGAHTLRTAHLSDVMITVCDEETRRLQIETAAQIKAHNDAVEAALIAAGIKKPEMSLADMLRSGHFGTSGPISDLDTDPGKPN